MCAVELYVPASESEINTTPNSLAWFLKLLTFYYSTLTGKVSPGHICTECLFHMQSRAGNSGMRRIAHTLT